MFDLNALYHWNVIAMTKSIFISYSCQSLHSPVDFRLKLIFNYWNTILSTCGSGKNCFHVHLFSYWIECIDEYFTNIANYLKFSYRIQLSFSPIRYNNIEKNFFSADLLIFKGICVISWALNVMSIFFFISILCK